MATKSRLPRSSSLRLAPNSFSEPHCNSGMLVGACMEPTFGPASRDESKSRGSQRPLSRATALRVVRSSGLRIYAINFTTHNTGTIARFGQTRLESSPAHLRFAEPSCMPQFVYSFQDAQPPPPLIYRPTLTLTLYLSICLPACASVCLFICLYRFDLEEKSICVGMSRAN